MSYDGKRVLTSDDELRRNSLAFYTRNSVFDYVSICGQLIWPFPFEFIEYKFDAYFNIINRLDAKCHAYDTIDMLSDLYIYLLMQNDLLIQSELEHLD